MAEIANKVPAAVAPVEDMDVEVTRPTDNLALHFFRTEINKTFFEIPNHYEQLVAIGVGAYGAVISAVDTVRKERVALKKLNRPFQTAIHAKRTYREIKLLKHMKHENVIGLLDLFTPQMNVQTVSNFRDVYLVNDLMGADMNQIIKSQKLSDDHVQFLVYQLLRGLKYIHSVGIIHRDLKPSNIAVNEDCGLKILDFGLARQHDEEMTGYVATRWYRAPEIMLNWMHYGASVDVWSVGCIMSELITRKPLFPGNDHIDQLTLILKVVGTPDDSFLERIPFDDAKQFIRQLPRFPPKSFKQLYTMASDSAIDLLEKMLDLDPEKRISAQAALEHPYLEQYHDVEDEPTGEKFDAWFEDKELTVDEWKELVLTEIKSFQPPPPPEVDEDAAENEEKKGVVATATAATATTTDATAVAAAAAAAPVAEKKT